MMEKQWALIFCVISGGLACLLPVIKISRKVPLKFNLLNNLFFIFCISRTVFIVAGILKRNPCGEFLFYEFLVLHQKMVKMLEDLPLSPLQNGALSIKLQKTPVRKRVIRRVTCIVKMRK